MRNTFLAVLVLVFLATVTAAQPKAAPRTTFDEHVLPIFKDKCVACHSADKKRGGLILNNYTLMMQGGSSGVSVKPGDPDTSLLYKLMAHTDEPKMPPSSPKLDDKVLAVVHKWIADGAPENAGSKVVVPTRPKVDFALKSAARGKPAVPPMPPATLSRLPLVSAPRETALTALAASPWAPLVAVAGQKQILLYHADTLELLGILPFPEGTPYILRFSRNGELLLAGGGQAGKSGKVAIWSITKGERLFTVGEETDAVLTADISPDQSLIALGGPSKMVRIYDTREGKVAHQIKKHTDWVTAVEFSPDGVLLATGDRNGGGFVWEANTAREFHALRGPTKAITAVSWRPDSNVVAFSSEDASVRLFEMENGNQIRTWNAHGGGTLHLSYGMDGRILTAGRDRTAKLWDGNGGAQRTFEALPDLALKAVLTHDSKRAIAGDWTGQVIVWDTADGKRLGTLSTNPPTLDQQLTAAKQTVDEKTKARAAALATSTASDAALQKVTADLTAARKRVTDTTAAAAAAETKWKQAQAAVASAQAALVAGQNDAKAKEVLAKELTDAAARVKGEADKAKDNAPLQAAAQRIQALATQAATERAQSLKNVEALTQALRTVEPTVPPAQQAYMAAQVQAQAAPKAVPPLEAALTAAQTKANTDKAALATAESQLKAAQELLDRLQKAAAAVASK